VSFVTQSDGGQQMNAQPAISPQIRQRIAAIPAEAALRLVLRLDAVVTGANGVAYLALADVLDSPLGISARPPGATKGRNRSWIRLAA
jgi:hypothetical protein